MKDKKPRSVNIGPIIGRPSPMSEQTPPTKIYPFGHSLKLDDGPACYYADSADAYIAALTARCEALEKEKATLREALKRENKEVCEAVTDAVRWQNSYHEAMLDVARLKAASGEQELR